jgi:hypothetical protein
LAVSIAFDQALHYFVFRTAVPVQPLTAPVDGGGVAKALAASRR